MLKLDNVIRGPGYWKMNCSVLRELEYVKKIKQVINKCEVTYEASDIDKVLFWEVLKMKIRGETINYCIEKKRESRRKQNLLENQIKELEGKDLDEYESNKLSECKIELAKIIDSQLKGDSKE